MKKSTTLQLVLAAMFTALGILLPIVVHQLGSNMGMVLLPMHIPILLCGLIVGSQYGALAGLIVPLLASAFTGSPQFWPIAVSMALELAAYGFFCRASF
jgi:thiamine transporter ThiT